MHYRPLRPTVEVPVSLAAMARWQGTPSVGVCTASFSYALQPLRPTVDVPISLAATTQRLGIPSDGVVRRFNFLLKPLRVTHELVNINPRFLRSQRFNHSQAPIKICLIQSGCLSFFLDIDLSVHFIPLQSRCQGGAICRH